MSRTRRAAIIASGAAVLVVALIVAASNKGSSDSKTASRPQTVTVVGAKPVGGIKTLTWKKGDTIDLRIKSDTADEVHFHGYDVHKDVAKGGSVQFHVPATIEGKFIVELEAHKQQLANVVVEP
jgi:hypothetical protein